MRKRWIDNELHVDGVKVAYFETLGRMYASLHKRWPDKVPRGRYLWVTVDGYPNPGGSGVMHPLKTLREVKRAMVKHCC